MKETIHKIICSALKKIDDKYLLNEEDLKKVEVKITKDPKHGDFTSNIALILGSKSNGNTLNLAEKICSLLPACGDIYKIEAVEPGFINFYLYPQAIENIMTQILVEKENYGRSKPNNKTAIVEYVSTNPTGPVHVGHGRGAVFGSVIANILEASGFKVHREYYINDHGRQIEILTLSVWFRYLETIDSTLNLPNEGYVGEYVKDIAVKLFYEYNDKFTQSHDKILAVVAKCNSFAGEQLLDNLILESKKLLINDFGLITDFTLNEILTEIRDDLSKFKIYFDQWFSEKDDLLKTKRVDEAIDILIKKGETYKKDNALWFRASKFGDEKDRVLIRSNGQSTYFASDVAYHLNKFQRGFDLIINVWGADHHGYVMRIRAAIKALGFDSELFITPIAQLSSLIRGEEKIQISTRSASFITLRSLIDEVGIDEARFFYLMFKIDQHMDFDLELAKAKSEANPFYYIQYAHARICSIIKQEKIEEMTKNIKSATKEKPNNLTNKKEKRILLWLGKYPEVIIEAKAKLEPHIITQYLRELAYLFHTYYNSQRILTKNPNLRLFRLQLISAIKQVLVNGFDILGIEAKESM